MSCRGRSILMVRVEAPGTVCDLQYKVWCILFPVLRTAVCSPLQCNGIVGKTYMISALCGEYVMYYKQHPSYIRSRFSTCTDIAGSVYTCTYMYWPYIIQPYNNIQSFDIISQMIWSSYDWPFFSWRNFESTPLFFFINFTDIDNMIRHLYISYTS